MGSTSIRLKGFVQSVVFSQEDFREKREQYWIEKNGYDAMDMNEV